MVVPIPDLDCKNLSKVNIRYTVQQGRIDHEAFRGLAQPYIDHAAVKGINLVLTKH